MHVASPEPGTGDLQSVSRTYEETNLCEAAAATELLYPWPIYTCPDRRTQTPS